MIASQEWNFRQSLGICDNQLAWYYYFSPDISITSITMTLNEINNSGEIYSGALESAPEIEELKCYPVEDTSVIDKY